MSVQPTTPTRAPIVLQARPNLTARVQIAPQVGEKRPNPPTPSPATVTLIPLQKRQKTNEEETQTPKPPTLSSSSSSSSASVPVVSAPTVVHSPGQSPVRYPLPPRNGQPTFSVNTSPQNQNQNQTTTNPPASPPSVVQNGGPGPQDQPQQPRVLPPASNPFGPKSPSLIQSVPPAQTISMPPKSPMKSPLVPSPPKRLVQTHIGTTPVSPAAAPIPSRLSPKNSPPSSPPPPTSAPSVPAPTVVVTPTTESKAPSPRSPPTLPAIPAAPEPAPVEPEPIVQTVVESPPPAAPLVTKEQPSTNFFGDEEDFDMEGDIDMPFSLPAVTSTNPDPGVAPLVAPTEPEQRKTVPETTPQITTPAPAPVPAVSPPTIATASSPAPVPAVFPSTIAPVPVVSSPTIATASPPAPVPAPPAVVTLAPKAPQRVLFDQDFPPPKKPEIVVMATHPREKMIDKENTHPEALLVMPSASTDLAPRTISENQETLSEIAKMRMEFEAFKRKNEEETYKREGEISFLRQQLSMTEEEKHKLSSELKQKADQIDGLASRISFQEQEIETLAGETARKSTPPSSVSPTPAVTSPSPSPSPSSPTAPVASKTIQIRTPSKPFLVTLPSSIGGRDSRASSSSSPSPHETTCRSPETHQPEIIQDASAPVSPTSSAPKTDQQYLRLKKKFEALRNIVLSDPDFLSSSSSSSPMQDVESNSPSPRQVDDGRLQAQLNEAHQKIRAMEKDKKQLIELMKKREDEKSLLMRENKSYLKKLEELKVEKLQDKRNTKYLQKKVKNLEDSNHTLMNLAQDLKNLTTKQRDQLLEYKRRFISTMVQQHADDHSHHHQSALQLGLYDPKPPSNPSVSLPTSSSSSSSFYPHPHPHHHHGGPAQHFPSASSLTASVLSLQSAPGLLSNFASSSSSSSSSSPSSFSGISGDSMADHPSADVIDCGLPSPRSLYDLPSPSSSCSSSPSSVAGSDQENEDENENEDHLLRDAKMTRSSSFGSTAQRDNSTRPLVSSPPQSFAGYSFADSNKANKAEHPPYKRTPTSETSDYARELARLKARSLSPPSSPPPVRAASSLTNPRPKPSLPEVTTKNALAIVESRIDTDSFEVSCE